MELSIGNKEMLAKTNIKRFVVSDREIENKTHNLNVKNDVLDIVGELNRVLTGPNEVKGLLTDVTDIIYKQFDMKKYSTSIKNMNTLIQNFKNDIDSKKYLVDFNRKAVPDELKSKTTLYIDELLVNKRQDELSQIISTSLNPQEKNVANTELAKINTYIFSKLLLQINKEKMFKSGVSNGVKVINVAGNVAILLKFDTKTIAIMKDIAEKSVMGIRILDVILKTGRDKADEEKSPDWLKKLFDQNESTHKKLEKLDSCSEFIMNLYENLPDRDKQLSLEERRQIKYAENFVLATGCDLKNFKSCNGKHFEQKKILLNFMKKEV